MFGVTDTSWTTPDLCDDHHPHWLRVLDGGLLRTFGGRESFHGPVETLSCFEDNSFDVGQKHEFYCTWQEIKELVSITKAKLGWHTWSHRNLCTLSDEEVRREITPPFPMKYFAYPYGDVDARVARLVEEAGYEEAWSVTQGDGSRFQRRRRYLNW